MVSWVYTYTNMYRINHFKYVWFVVRQLYMNKVVVINAKVMKDQERLKNRHSLEVTKETWQLNPMWDPDWIREQNTKKDISGKTGEIQIKSVF